MSWIFKFNKVFEWSELQKIQWKGEGVGEEALKISSAPW